MAASLQRQLYTRLRDAILNGNLAPGARLPATRTYAQALSVSRNTVIAAYAALEDEGYVVPSTKGTRVAAMFPLIDAGKTTSAIVKTTSSQPKPTAGGTDTQGTSWQPEMRHLSPGVPAVEHFPLNAWRRSLDRAIRSDGASVLNYGHQWGEPALREAIARHVGVTRGAYCDQDQVIVTGGTQEALSICVQLLAKHGDVAWIEDPGYRGAKAIMRSAGMEIIGIPVDEGGMMATDERWDVKPPRLIYTTPSHQYPLGAVLSVARRIDLLRRASTYDSWIIEDDYDSEFRHHGEPVRAMQGLVPDARVLYIGSFGKSVFPSLSLGFLVLPRALIAAARSTLGDVLKGGRRVEQLALADFIERGHFSAHLSRMRRLYRARQQHLKSAIRKFLPEATVEGGNCGLHLTVRLTAEYPDVDVARLANDAGLGVIALSNLSIAPGTNNGLIIGYGDTDWEHYEKYLKKLAGICHRVRK